MRQAPIEPRCCLSGKRPNPPAWLADHVIFFSYRWLAWGLTAIWLLVDGRMFTHVGWIMLALAALNVPTTLYAQRYVRIARRNPLALIVDVVFGVGVIVQSGGWNSPLLACAYGGLVLPALLFGWRGGVMAGLTFVAVEQAALWAAGTPASTQVTDGLWPTVALVLRMVAPPVAGSLIAPLVELVRQRAARRRPVRPRQRFGPEERYGQDVRAGFSRSRPPVPDDGGMERLIGERVMAAQAIRTRTAERSVEELRRVIFAALPSPDIDLAAALDLLALRFGQHTGAATSMTLLGRVRAIRPVHRDLLIRLAQEALLNIQQHAHAASAAITLHYDSTSVALLIQDDGIGLIDGTYKRPGLHALRAMHYRLAECGGRLDVFETEGGGVTVRATMPLE